MSNDRKEGVCRSQLRKSELDFKWIVGQFQIHADVLNTKELTSTAFSLNNTRWQLVLKPKSSSFIFGVSPLWPDPIVAVYLEMVEDSGEPAIAKFVISIIDNNDCLVHSRCSTQKFRKGSRHGFNSFMKYSTLLDNRENLLDDDALTLYCHLVIYSEEVESAEVHMGDISENNSLSDDIAACFLDKRFSDVTIVVNDDEIPAHKLILCARSPVFSKFFAQNTSTKRIQIENMTYESTLETIRFMYTGACYISGDSVVDILYVADKYDIKQLKRNCENFLLNKLNVDNAAQLYVLGCMHCAGKLVDGTKDFISKNLKAVKETEDYGSQIEAHPHLFIDFF